MKALRETNPYAGQAELQIGQVAEGFERARSIAITEALLAVAFELRMLREENASNGVEIVGALREITTNLEPLRDLARSVGRLEAYR